MSVRLNNPQIRVLKTTTNLAATPFTFGFFFKVWSLPGTGVAWFAGVRTSHSGAGGLLGVTAAGLLELMSHSNSITDDSAGAITTGVWYYGELSRFNSTSNGDPYQFRYVLANGGALIDTLAVNDWGESGGWDDWMLGSYDGGATYGAVSVCGAKVFSVQHSDAQCLAEAGQLAAVDTANEAATFTAALPDVSTLGVWALNGAGTATTDTDNPTFGGGPAPDAFVTIKLEAA